MCQGAACRPSLVLARWYSLGEWWGASVHRWSALRGGVPAVVQPRSSARGVLHSLSGQEAPPGPSVREQAPSLFSPHSGTRGTVPHCSGAAPAHQEEALCPGWRTKVLF